MSWLTSLPSLDIIYIILILAGLLTSIWFKPVFGDGLRLLPILCLVYLLLELLSAYATDFYYNNHFVYHFFSPFEHTIYAIIFYRILSRRQLKEIVRYSIPLFILMSMSISWIDGLEHTTSKIFVVRALLMFLFCIFYFSELLSGDHLLPSRIPGELWFCIGIMFHFGGRLFISGLMDALLSEDLQLARSVYYSGYVFNYLLFLIIIFIALQQQRTQR